MCNAFNKKFIDEAAKAAENSNHNYIQGNTDHAHFMGEAIKLAIQGVKNNDGGPFGCVIVKNGKIIGKGNNKVTSTNDPSAHAEITAIREACKNLDTFQLDGCTLYTSCEPCPMCLGAIYWARPDKVFYASDKKDAAKIGFDDEFIYNELEIDLSERKIPFKQISRDASLKAFKIWDEKDDKMEY